MMLQHIITPRCEADLISCESSAIRPCGRGAVWALRRALFGRAMFGDAAGLGRRGVVESGYT